MKNKIKAKNYYLALDLVEGDLEVFNVGDVGGGNPTRIRVNGGAIAEDADGCECGENDGVCDPGRGEEAEPPVDENEHGGDVNVRDAQNDDAHGERENEAPLLLLLLRFLRHGAGVYCKTTAFRERKWPKRTTRG